MDQDIALETWRSAEQHSLPRRPPLSARSPFVVAARHAGEGSVVELLLLFGACAKLGRPAFIIIEAEVT